MEDLGEGCGTQMHSYRPIVASYIQDVLASKQIWRSVGEGLQAVIDNVRGTIGTIVSTGTLVA